MVKLQDEVCVSHTKRVGENKAVFATQEVRSSFCNSRSSQKCYSLVYPFKNNQKHRQEKAVMQILQENM